MNPLDFLENEELLRFLSHHKTEISCMENPLTFVNQLRDYNLIPEDKYKKISRMTSKEKLKKNVYEVLDWVETERPEHMKVFWHCVFNDTIMNQYPKLRELRRSLMDGSFHLGFQLPEKLENKKKEQEKKQEPSQDKERGKQNISLVKKKKKKEKKKRRQRDESVCDNPCEDEERGELEVTSVKKKRRKERDESVCDNTEDEERPGPSCPVTPTRKRKSAEKSSSSSQKKKNNIWTWPIYKVQFPVTCGHQEGILIRGRLARGEKCIVVGKQWFTPPEFERFAGKHSYKNWKLSIRCEDTPLGKLIKEGHLKSQLYKGGHKKAQKTFPAADLSRDNVIEVEESDEDDQASTNTRQSSPGSTDEEEERGEQNGQQSQNSQDSQEVVYKVTCGSLEGTLDKRRFASGTRGKSVRTEKSWLTPVEFTREALGQIDALWRKDIECNGEPLSALIESEVLVFHSELCSCTLCQPSKEDLENQKNDDECCLCKSEKGKLVECDECPRSFHQKCHLPHVEDTICGTGGQWTCTFCVFRINQEYYHRNKLTMEDAKARDMSQHMLECQYVFMRLCCANEKQAFTVNPCLYLQDYSDVIETPMWLGSIADKLQRRLYKTVGEFVSDVQLIFANCAMYDRETAGIQEEAKRLQKIFDKDFKDVFNISS